MTFLLCRSLVPYTRKPTVRVDIDHRAGKRCATFALESLERNWATSRRLVLTSLLSWSHRLSPPRGSRATLKWEIYRHVWALKSTVRRISSPHLHLSFPRAFRPGGAVRSREAGVIGGAHDLNKVTLSGSLFLLSRLRLRRCGEDSSSDLCDGLLFGWFRGCWVCE